ncbi:chemotaxis protein MotB [Butyrivibrio hungatei DSM 14810]|uniref:Flagellar motor protein MotB n=2 Tax=Butyrivibrio hungatei TaxID=185008 RepID=A0A1D9P284_9FIRM|nr:flagellar motor protein MotB [Butyrivibrio hungatei]AOZ96464.1 flagellar motor protein MotB [Butyrivibrio hungatei]SHN63229.1 chemotaxis protein MotB [Butyrivibrio hungatei DSM 14810]
MAKRQEEIKPGLPAWQGTFGDLMNLLLCFFVLLFSMANMDAAKFEEVAASFSNAFGIFSGGEMAIGQGALIGDGVSQLSALSSYITSMGLAQSGEDSDSEETAIGEMEQKELLEAAEEEQMEASEELAEKIEAALEAGDVDNEVSLNYTSQFVQLTIQGSILFDSGKTDIKDDAIPVIDKVGQILETYAGGTIEIEGHTDNVPMSSGGKYANNDELSSGRALSIFYYLCENTNLDPANIVHTGRGEYSPIADNSTDEGRARNRRVEIKIYNPLSSSY